MCIWFGALLDFRHPSGVLEPLPWVRGGGNHCTILLSRVAGQLKKGVGRIWNQSILAEGLVQRWCCGRQKELGVAGSRGRGTVGREGLWRGEATSCGFARLAVFGLQKPRLPFLEWDLSDWALSYGCATLLFGPVTDLAHCLRTVLPITPLFLCSSSGSSVPVVLEKLNNQGGS